MAPKLMATPSEKDFKALCDKVWGSDLTRDQVIRLAAILRDKQDRLDTLARLSFSLGDRVKFMSPRGMIFGTCVNHLRRNMQVKDDHGVIWRVSPSLLEYDS